MSLARFAGILFLLFALGPFMPGFYAHAQRGRITKPATSSVMDPNADGFVSKTAAGFSNDGYYVDEFEIRMFGIPKLTGDVAGDNIGKSCGITDLIPDRDGFSVYAVRDVGNNLIFRFRVGDDNPSVEAWTILLDTDGLFGSSDPNATNDNPGFEVDITLIKNPQAGVFVYDIDGNSGCPAPFLSYNLATNFQIAIADEVSCGDPDYFYDIFVPFAPIANYFNISETSGVRFAAVTNVSATCALSGKIADISGVDYDEYRSCVPCAFTALVDNQCPTAIADLCETCAGFEKEKVNKPTIDLPVRAGQTVISGTSDPDIFIVVEVYERIGGTDTAPIWSTTPRETKSGYAVGTVWSLTLTNPLIAFDRIVARALRTENSVPCGANGGNLASVSVTVVQPNTPPAAVSQSVTVVEDVPRIITLSGTDPEGDALLYSLVTSPSHGSLTGTPPNVTYTPASNFFGNDSFTFQVSDGIYQSALPGVVTITVTPVNDAPIAQSQTLSTTEDTPRNIVLTAADVDGDALTYVIVTGPSSGLISGTPPTITYTPNAHFNGTDQFTFRVNDGTVNSNLASVSITVTSVPDPPVAFNQNVSTSEDVSLSIALAGSDPDGDALTYQVTGNPTNGILGGTAPNLTYIPNANYFGPDNFTFTVSDGSNVSNTATVAVTVLAVNDPPIANNQSATYDLNTLKVLTLAGTDVDGDPISFSILENPDNGTLGGVAPNVTYMPDLNYNGDDQFTFVVSDGTLTSAPGTVSLFFNPGVNVAPIAGNQSVVLNEDANTTIVLAATDANGDNLTFLIVNAPTHGTLGSLNGANVVYTPAPNYFGPDNFTFKANDGTFDSNEATVSITVVGTSDAPQAISQVVSTAEDTPKALVLTASDPDNDALTYEIIDIPVFGSLTGAPPNVTYTPQAHYYGSDNFTFRVNDGTSNSNTATVAINVAAVGDRPVGNSRSDITTLEEVAVTFVLTGSDADGDPITFAIITPPAHGTLQLVDATVTYTPNPDFFGQDSFQFVVNDGTSDSDPTSVVITVIGVDDPPSAIDQSVITQEDVAIDILLGATDPDNDPLSFAISEAPLHGTLSGSGPNVTYTPAANYSGTDRFRFTAADANTTSNVATVSVTIAPQNDAPVISVPLVFYTKEDSTLRVCLSVVDAEGESISYLEATNLSGGGTMQRESAPFDFCYQFTPIPNFFGDTDWQMAVSDASDLESAVAIKIVVLPVNDTLTIPEQRFVTKQDSAIDICIDITDVEDDPATLTQAASVFDLGSLLNESLADLCARYQPPSGFYGQDRIEVTICETVDEAVCATREVIIDVFPREDLPPEFFDDDDDDDNGDGTGTRIDTLFLQTDEDVALPFCVEVRDPNGEAVTFAGATNLSGGGVLTLEGGAFCFEYVPALNFFGTAVAQISFCDEPDPLQCGTLTVVIEVRPVNDPPTARADTLFAIRYTEEQINVLSNDFDVDGDPLKVTQVASPQSGIYDWSAEGQVTYRSDRYFRGNESIQYQVCDNAVPEMCATQTLVLVVDDLPLKPYEAFSPNGDGTNDYWRIEGIDFYANNRVRIFDRYNNLVFELEGYNNEEKVWRGDSNYGLSSASLKEGTFFYSIELEQGSKPIKGFVVLKRE